MDVEFTGAHIETLCELKALAERPGCRITIEMEQSKIVWLRM